MLIELVGIGLLLICAGFAVRHKFAAPEMQLRQAERALTKLTGRQQPDHKQVEAVFRRLYRIANQSIAAGQERFVYEAAELLKLTSLSIADIGNAVGYPNQLHFSRAFKNTYGTSPRSWRNENKLEPDM